MTLSPFDIYLEPPQICPLGPLHWPIPFFCECRVSHITSSRQLTGLSPSLAIATVWNPQTFHLARGCAIVIQITPAIRSPTPLRASPNFRGLKPSHPHLFRMPFS